MSGRVPAAGGVAAPHGRFVATRLIVIASAALSATCVAPVRIDT
jgi:hypothetical protein